MVIAQLLPDAGGRDGGVAYLAAKSDGRCFSGHAYRQFLCPYCLLLLWL